MNKNVTLVIIHTSDEEMQTLAWLLQYLNETTVLEYTSDEKIADNATVAMGKLQSALGRAGYSVR